MLIKILITTKQNKVFEKSWQKVNRWDQVGLATESLVIRHLWNHLCTQNWYIKITVPSWSQCIKPLPNPGTLRFWSSNTILVGNCAVQSRSKTRASSASRLRCDGAKQLWTMLTIVFITDSYISWSEVLASRTLETVIMLSVPSMIWGKKGGHYSWYSFAGISTLFEMFVSLFFMVVA